MTYQTNHLRLPILSFFGVPLSVVSLPNRGMKKRNEANQQAQPVVPYSDPESSFTKRSQNITSRPSESLVAKKSKQTQISLFSSDNQAFIKKQTQIKPKIWANPDVYPSVLYGVLRNEAKSGHRYHEKPNEPKIERPVPTEGGSEIRHNNGGQSQS